MKDYENNFMFSEMEDDNLLHDRKDINDKEKKEENKKKNMDLD